MDAPQALADLTEISSQIRAAVLFDESGEVAASTLDSEERSRELAQAATDLRRTAEGPRTGGDAELTQLEAATVDGSVFVVRQGARRIVATTRPEPTVGLVLYDLHTARRRREDDPEPAQPPRRPPRRQAVELLPRQVPLRDASGAPPPDRRAARGDGAGARARGRAARRPRARRRRPRRGRVTRVGAAVPDRPQGREGVRNRETP